MSQKNRSSTMEFFPWYIFCCLKIKEITFFTKKVTTKQKVAANNKTKQNKKPKQSNKQNNGYT